MAGRAEPDEPDPGPGPQPVAGPFADAILDALFTQSSASLYVFDPDLRLVRVNSAARLFQEIPDEQILGRPLEDILQGFEVIDSPRLRQMAQQVLRTGEPARGLRVRMRSRATPPSDVIVSASAFRLEAPGSGVLGLCAALTDITAQERAQQGLRLLNEAATQVGTTLDVFRTAAEFCDLTVPGFADTVVLDVYDSVLRGRAPVPDARDPSAELRRAGFRSVKGEDQHGVPAVGEMTVYPPGTPYQQVLGTLAPRLIRRLRADVPWLRPERRRDARIRDAGVHSMLLVPVRARGVVLGLACFYRWRNPVPFDRTDRRLAEQLTAHAGLCLDNARLYGRERSAARVVAAGPGHPDTPAPSAVELAHTYVPAGAGGGWFDVIPLSGARVALVAGDTSPDAPASPSAMCELRAAIEALADLDLPPDEILERLHDLAGRPRTGPARGDGLTDSEVARATCLCVVYDPVTRICAAAGAGHPAPVLVHRDGRVERLDIPSGPPLGQGVAHYRAEPRTLPEGTILMLYNSALVAPLNEADEAVLDRLRGLLAMPHESRHESLQSRCDAIAAALAPEQPRHDAYLLLVRTRTFAADRTCSWTLPNAPESVSAARRLATRQLADWGLDGELSDNTALIVSELVTNVVRYAKGQIRLRLILDNALFCEISDDSSTAPHLRRAMDADEYGRGLFITAQLTQRWGVRPAGRGKTVWAEQAIIPAP